MSPPSSSLSSTDELKNNITRRGTIKGKLSRMKKFVEAYNADTDNPNALKTRLVLLDNIYKQFDDIQTEIELDSTVKQDDQLKEREEFESTYCEVITKIRTLLEPPPPAPSSASVTSNQPVTTPAAPAVDTFNEQQINVKLPALNLPEFSGKLSEWLSFHDTFKALIHDNRQLTDVQRFHYLRACLKDEALRTVESLVVSEANYAIAWKALEKRYKNTRLIIQEHICSMWYAPSIPKTSHVSLRQLLDNVNNNIAALKSLGEPTWGSLLVTIIAEKLDYATKREWQSNLGTQMPKFEEFMAFLDNRCQILESLSVSNKQSNFNNNSKPNAGNVYVKQYSNNSNNPGMKDRGRSTSHLSTSKPSCRNCKAAGHSVFQCTKFLNLSIEQRWQAVRSLRLCENCLRENHSPDQCKSTSKCRECRQNHNTLLHFNDNHNNGLIVAQPSTSGASNHCHVNVAATVLLSTAVILVKDANNEFKKCRALLDVGSDCNFITAGLCKKLGLKLKNTGISVAGINQTNSVIKQSANITIKSQHNAFSAHLQCLVLPAITNRLPHENIDIKSLHIPDNIKLADAEFHKPGPIDILIGADLFWNLLCVGQIKGQPTFQKTHLGWIAGGRVSQNTLASACFFSQSGTNDNDKSLETQVNKFFEIEEYQPAKPLTVEEQLCESHFRTTFRRDKNGRFIVKLPFRDNGPKLGESYDIALKRFESLERKLQKLPNVKEQYVAFMTEYRELNHMELVSPTELACRNSCYLPHHAVIKETSTTTKLRVVFDCSNKTTNNLSLNTVLMNGPVLQDDIFSILVRFRSWLYAINGDIEKMYRQILIDSEHTDFQRIFWRDKCDSPMQIFRLTTLTYGTKPASYIATRCLQQLAYENQEAFPLAASTICRDFYMDDLLTGANSINELVKLRNEVSSILATGGFHLRKWASNCPDALVDIDGNNDTQAIINLDKDGNTKTLGLTWNCHSDNFKFQVKLGAGEFKITKRSILSTIAHIFDPLGLLAPVVIKTKFILQQLWSLKLDWDESVPLHIHSEWTQLLNELTYLNELQIPRKLIGGDPIISRQLLGYCDASERGYGAVIYLRSTNQDMTHSIVLICAKSKVAPLKAVTLPRLELCGALLLARLMKRVEQSLNLSINNIFLWTDSTIVLSWLMSTSKTWKTFVANRVAEIQSLFPTKCWGHVRTEDNPADIISRGLLPKQLRDNSLWWIGPPWLGRDQQQWPHPWVPLDQVETLERRQANVATSYNEINSTELPVLFKFSSFAKLQAVIALCLRFLYCCRNKEKKVNEFSREELQSANKAIFRAVQRVHFAKELRDLAKDGKVNKNSKLLALSPFLDNTDGLIRVGGRLRHSSLPFDRKFPVILPKNHHVSKLLIQYEHARHLHIGVEGTLAALRQTVWIISARSAIREFIHKCIKCFKAEPRASRYKMGDLPRNRIEPSRPFDKTGVDYCGPFSISYGRGRGSRVTKAYVALFVCFATKAIHIELVGDLTTEAFINAFKRFTARRGHVSDIYSDNGTNFIGAQRELKKNFVNIIKADEFKQFKNELLLTNTTWHFMPPKGPHMGGLWESNIKSVKRILKRVVGTNCFSFEVFYTLLTRIEAILNSRPLTPLSSDPNDFAALTPGHFLIGGPLTALPEPNLVAESKVGLSRWKQAEICRQHFWKRWQQEYLSHLQIRTKWTQDGEKTLHLGDLVLLREDNVPPLQWPTGRVKELHPGTDGVVRVVTVQTVRGVFKRPVNRVSVLPVYN